MIVDGKFYWAWMCNFLASADTIETVRKTLEEAKEVVSLFENDS